MQLCANHPGGFGPHSTLLNPLPTSCFTLTILLPLPTWLALLLLPILTLISLAYRKKNFNPSTRRLRSVPPRSCAFATSSSIYYLLILAMILMQTLEIVRLELIHWGISLLPFVYVGLLLGGILHFSRGFLGRVKGWEGVNAVVWLGGVVMCAVQVAGLVKEGDRDARKGSKYPVGDQVTDVAVMAGVYAVIAGLELVLGIWRVRRETGNMGVKASPVGKEMGSVKYPAFNNLEN